MYLIIQWSLFRGLYESAALYQQGASEMKNAMNEIEVTKQYEQQIKQLSKDEVSFRLVRFNNFNVILNRMYDK